MSDNTSILKKFQRQPKLYIDLPSKGKYYAPGSVTKTEELEVYSMTAADEIIIKTPDALLNGEATVRVIQNCVPGIKDAWQIPVIDIYTILSAIRMASYGDDYAVTATCPSCKETNEYKVSLGNSIETFRNKRFVDYIKEDELEFYFKPQTYKQFTEVNKKLFTMQRQLQQHVDKIKDQDEKDREMQKIFDGIQKIRVETVLKSIEKIRIGDEEEDNWDEIVEFVSTNDKKYYNRIEDIAVKNNTDFAMPPATVICAGCEEQYKTDIELDYSNFFVAF